ncbi:MAG: hypothetical protein JNK37_24810 [Verrucomicrobiales bacterium]|nr:hypothetical protein [Verrucomicrobiales bacterium]
MLSPVWIVGFSGHRKVPDREGAARELEMLFQRLAERIKAAGGTPALCTSPAAGADLLALTAAEKAGFSIHLVLPLPVDEFRHDFEDTAEWSIASEWIAKATMDAEGSTIRTPSAILPRPECYYESGLDIVSASDVLVVYWDGEPANGLGGTSDVVDLAKSQGKPVLRVDTRAQPHGAESVSPLTGLPESWPEPDPVIERLNHLIREEHVSATANAGEIQNLFDSIADRRAPQFRRGVARAIWIHALAALIGAVPSLFYFAIVPKSAAPSKESLEKWGKLAQAFTAVELVLVLAALVVTLLLYWGKTQQRWLMTRFAAELVRGLRAARPWLNPLNPQVDRHLPGWRRFAITVSLRACPDALPGESLDKKKQHYLKWRISHQAEHYREKSESAEHAHHRWHTLAKWAAILAPFAVTFALADKMFELELTKSWWGAFCGKFLPVALPLTAASATAMRNALDLTRRATRYPEMVQRLAASELALESAKTELSASQVISRTEEILLDELIEWNLAASNAGAH